jgi:hypothetical protein
MVAMLLETADRLNSDVGAAVCFLGGGGAGYQIHVSLLLRWSIHAARPC